ncbi:DUF431-domain-containing protein [Cylindrobasidium torrendii FP15055 ss-10]|uniref:DUF431-domain-containing protein n=1 Tax=Cylindrobasidium torrendii FP15055 ss-10 TaxID=1314674 RepID=A0A0D7BMB7_9AGAR|nr:DUF431-domain-containing protein [Cylindrobasidium torrendii FP15055 ss-10]
MGFTYIIEHMEEDEPASASSSTKTLPPWVKLEYSHMLSLAGPASEVHFTHLSASSVSTLELPQGQGQARPVFTTEDVLSRLRSSGISINEVCLLDPKGTEELSPADGDGRFKCFLFGGILGDDPPRDRTAELRVLGFPGRRLGPVQMTTDTALGVTKRVVEDGVKLDEIKYVDFPTITFSKHESVEMPFRYMVVEGTEAEPTLPPGMRELLREDLNKSFEF